MKLLSASRVTALLSFAAITFTTATEPGSLESVVDAMAQKELKAGRLTGMTIGVAAGDEVLLLKGYGFADVENELPATAESVYRIGSITKMFTAAAILLLVEDGKLSLDDPLTKFLPDYPSPGESVTLRHLLNHTSGIVNFTNLPSHRRDIRNDTTHEDIVARFQDLPFEFPPGARFKYCNSGYYLLGMIVEMVSGKDYEAFLDERITGPLSLDATVYDRQTRIIPHRARGYNIWGGNTVNAPFVSMTQPFAAGALASTAGDLLSWGHALSVGDLLVPASRELMVERGRLNDGKRTPYGLGCFLGNLDDHAFVRHGGGIVGFLSELAIYPESGHTIVVLLNANGARPKPIADRIARELFSEE